MNNSKMWLVVKPTVGVPLFLPTVAVGSFAVHVAVLSNTTWVADFLSGNDLGSGAESAALKIETPDLAKVAYTGTDGSIVVEMPDGTLAHGMADVLLEPYGGQVLQMSVAETTQLTAVFGIGTLIGLAAAWRMLSGGCAPERVAAIGAFVGVPGFALIISASQLDISMAFVIGTRLTGIGAGLFGHVTLTATIRRAPAGHIGLALGAWGATQATAAGLGVAFGGVARDIITGLPGAETRAPEVPYVLVFAAEIAFLVIAFLVVLPLWRRRTEQARAEIYVP